MGDRGCKDLGPLVDSFGRRHNSLRISVTDRCNIRCFYCMPATGVRFLPRSEILSFEEIERLVRLFAACGVDRVRLTGGEPLVRAEIDRLVQMLKAVPGIEEVAMTTNAVTLADQAPRLRRAGLDRLNISLDALSRETFVRITRRDVLDQVLAGIEAAIEAGFSRIRLNAVAIAQLSESEILPLADFALQRQLELRFIEFMPLDSGGDWQAQQVLSGAAIRQIIERQYGPLVPAPRQDMSQPAEDFFYAGGRGRLGLIHPVTQPFCSHCNRLRLTAEGRLRNCLFSMEEWDLRAILRGDAVAVDEVGAVDVVGAVEPDAVKSDLDPRLTPSDARLLETIRRCLAAKQAGHLIGQAEFQRPARSMHQIGG